MKNESKTTQHSRAMCPKCGVIRGHIYTEKSVPEGTETVCKCTTCGCGIRRIVNIESEAVVEYKGLVQNEKPNFVYIVLEMCDESGTYQPHRFQETRMDKNRIQTDYYCLKCEHQKGVRRVLTVLHTDFMEGIDTGHIDRPRPCGLY